MHAATGKSGGVRVPEFVVYNAQQCVPRYVLAVRQVARGAPTALAAPAAAAAAAAADATTPHADACETLAPPHPRADAAVAGMAEGFVCADASSAHFGAGLPFDVDRGRGPFGLWVAGRRQLRIDLKRAALVCTHAPRDGGASEDGSDRFEAAMGLEAIFGIGPTDGGAGFQLSFYEAGLLKGRTRVLALRLLPRTGEV